MTARRFREYRQLYIVYPELAFPIHKYLISNEEIRRTLSAELGSIQKGRTLSAELESFENVKVVLSKGSELKTEANRLFNKIPASQLLKISTIEDPLKRFFYEVGTIRGCWSYRELDRQISSFYYERSGLSGNKEALAALVNKSAQTLTPHDTITSPMALEFLGLNSNVVITENDLEQAILDNLQQFLLELGEGWCFEGRQKRILIDEDYFKIDLVFYSRILKCHLLIELKFTNEFQAFDLALLHCNPLMIHQLSALV